MEIHQISFNMKLQFMLKILIPNILQGELRIYIQMFTLTQWRWFCQNKSVSMSCIWLDFNWSVYFECFREVNKSFWRAWKSFHLSHKNSESVHSPNIFHLICGYLVLWVLKHILSPGLPSWFLLSISNAFRQWLKFTLIRKRPRVTRVKKTAKHTYSQLLSW